MTFDANRYTEKSREAVVSAQTESRRRGHQQVDTWHLLAGLLLQADGTVPAILKHLGITPSAMELAVGRELDKLPRVSGGTASGTVYITEDLNRVFTEAENQAAAMKDEFVSTEHLLLALIQVKKPEALAKLMESFDLTGNKVRESIKALRGSQRVTNQNPEATYDVLNKYGIDLVETARSGKLDPVIGRDTEINRVIQILSRRTKNNPMLIGEAGVGKTAIAAFIITVGRGAEPYTHQYTRDAGWAVSVSKIKSR